MRLDGLLIVEGQSDKAYISSLIDADIFITKGFDFNDEDIEFIKSVSEIKNIYLLTDSDEAGEEIRKKIKAKIPSIIDLRIDKSCCHKNNKHGVAEAEKNALLDVFKPLLKNDEISKNNRILPSKLLQITEFDKNKQQYLSRLYHLGNSNIKSMCKRLNILEIKEEQLVEDLKQYGNK